MNRSITLLAGCVALIALSACDNPTSNAPTKPGTSATAVEPAPVVAAPAAATDVALEEVQLDLPFYEVIGTPVELPSDVTVDPNAPPRKPLLAPPGATNLALEKPVTGSGKVFMGSHDQITDGLKRAADEFFVEMEGGTQWMQIDLEQRAIIYGLMIWHYHAQERVYRDVIVQVSNDADFTTASTLFNNDHDNSSGLGAGKDREYIESHKGLLVHVEGGRLGRYVRLYSRGNTVTGENHYIEVEVFGVPSSDNRRETSGETRRNESPPTPAGGNTH